MALVKFISGEGVEHEVEEASAAAAHMIASGFQRVESVETADEETAGEIDDLPAGEPVVYTEEDAIAQNDGEIAASVEPTARRRKPKA